MKIIPLVGSSLNGIPKQFCNRLKQIGIKAGTAPFKKTVLLRTEYKSRRSTREGVTTWEK